MTYFAYITDQCNQDARKYNVQSVVERLANQIESQQSSDHLDPFGTIFLKKDIGRSYRLIIGKVYDQEDCLHIFWKIMPKSSKEYRDFIELHQNAIEDFTQYKNQLPLQDIWISKRQDEVKISNITVLSPEERDFLYMVPGNWITDEWLVLESEDWVRRTSKFYGKNEFLSRNSSEDFTSYLSEIHPIIIEALEGTNHDTWVDNGRVGILYRKKIEERLLYLIAPIRAKDEEDKNSMKEKYQTLFNKDATTEDFLRRSRRAYPDVILYDDTLWIQEIQNQDEKANLALSREEADLLQSQAQGLYPLFINGRPGSGKSTVLQYLFANHLLSYHLQGKVVSPPLYITYNQDLLEIAKANTLRILTSNARKIIDNYRLSHKEAEELVHQSFYNLNDYLLSWIPEAEAFQKEKYLNFPAFRSRYESKFFSHPDRTIRSITAEMAWHAIRTYIKGMIAESDGYLEPDEYRNLPSKHKSLTNETYRKIHDAIWEKWYKRLCEEEGYWDDQDLTRKALQILWSDSLSLNLPCHSVVFCDEAQDFTRNELRLIFRLSVFSRRKLTPECLNRIPFAFAGDPFQTLNPTGFDWNATKENFYLSIRDQLDRRSNPSLEFNFRELSFNYRSRKNIVQLCNFIHLLRGIAFGKEGLRPQETWFDDPSNMPVYFDVQSPLVKTHLKEQSEIVIIVPCQQGEELDYVRNDPLLKTFALDLKAQKVTRNILSPIRAKGQEFSRVVIYKFGEECVENYPELLELLDPTKDSTRLSQEEMIPLEYFVNRLYVAASRAQRRLFIVDTATGIERFWKFFYDYPLEAFVEKYKKVANRQHEDFLWQADQHLVKIQTGDKSHWQADQDDPVELAKIFRDTGLRLKDAYQLELAAQNFRVCDREDEAIECEGYLYEFRKQYEKAGECFEKLGNFERAETNYWQARAYKKIVNLPSKTFRFKVAKFMLERNDYDFPSVREFYDTIVNEFHKQTIAPDGVWGEFLEQICKAIIEKSTEEDLKPYEWEKIYKDANTLMQRGILPKTSERLVQRLEVRATPFPRKLEVLERIGASAEEIVNAYPPNYKGDLTETQFKIIFEALKKLNRFEAIEKLIQGYPSLERYGSSIAISINEKRTEQLESLVQHLFVFLTNQKMWDVALDFANNHYLRLTDESATKTIRNHDWGYLLDACFIKALSVSEELPRESIPTKNEISKYLAFKLLEQASAFYPLLTISQAGAALERAGMIKDCLEFYDSVIKGNWPAQENDQQFARHRWLICKQRQVDLHKEEAGKRRIQREIEKRKEEWQILSISDLPEFPQVDLWEKPKPIKMKLRLPTKPEDNTETESLSHPPRLASTIAVTLTYGDQQFNCELSREKGKMTIRCQEAMEIVTVNSKNMKVQGSDDDFNAEIEERERKPRRCRYFIRPWNLTCTLRIIDNRKYVDLYFGEKEVELITLRLS